METSKFKAKFTGIVILTLILMTVVPISANYAQNQDGKFKEIAERAKEEVDELGAQIGEASEPKKTWPDDFPEEMQTSYSAAYNDLTAGRYKNAMKTYREVYRMLNRYSEAEGMVFEGGVEEEVQGSMVAIDRAYERIERIKDANETYFAIHEWNETIAGWIRENLTAAEENLTEAEAALEVPNAQWASANLTEANENISDAFAALKSLAEWSSGWRIESFLMGVKNSVEGTKEKLLLAKEQGIDLGVILGGIGVTKKDNDDDVDIDDFLLLTDELMSSARGSRIGKQMKKATETLKEIRQMLHNVHRALVEQRKGGAGRNEQ